MTKRDNFVALNTIVANASISEDEKKQMKAFIDHEIELLDNKKNSPKKPSKTKLENDKFKADILAALATADKAVTITELQNLCPSIKGLSNQRITHMLTDLTKATDDEPAKIKKEYVKKVPHFSLA